MNQAVGRLTEPTIAVAATDGAGAIETLVPVRAVKPRRRGIRLTGGWRLLAGPLVLLFAWQAVILITRPDPELIPTPRDVALAAWDLAASGVLIRNLWISLQRVGEGLAIGVTVGALVALLAGLQRGLGDILDSTMQVMKAIPVFALLPLFIIWTGIGEAPKVALIAVTVSLPIYINTYSSIRELDNSLLDVARTLGLGRAAIARHLLLPASLPGFLSGLRIALTSAWLALIFAETLNARGGLGSLMTDAQMAFRMDIILVVVSVYAVFGMAGYGLVLVLERLLLPWRTAFGGLS